MAAGASIQPSRTVSQVGTGRDEEMEERTLDGDFLKGGVSLDGRHCSGSGDGSLTRE